MFCISINNLPHDLHGISRSVPNAKILQLLSSIFHFFPMITHPTILAYLQSKYSHLSVAQWSCWLGLEYHAHREVSIWWIVCWRFSIEISRTWYSIMLHHRSVFYKIMIVPDFRSAGGLYDTLQPDLITAMSLEWRLIQHVWSNGECSLWINFCRTVLVMITPIISLMESYLSTKRPVLC